MPLYTEMHLFSYRYEMALPRSSALQRDHAHCPCGPFLPTSGAARQRTRRALRSTGASNLLRVSRRAAAIARKSPLGLRANRISSSRPRLTQRRHKPHAGSFAPKRRAHGRVLRRHTSWENRSAEGRCPLARPCMHYRGLWLSRLAFRQGGLHPLIGKHLRD